MIPCFKKIQQADRALVIRGSFDPDELRLLMDSLNPEGLLLLVMVKDLHEIDVARPILGL
jgi:hypothetical protein